MYLAVTKVTERIGLEDLHAVSRMKPNLNQLNYYIRKFIKIFKKKKEQEKIYTYKINSMINLFL